MSLPHTPTIALVGATFIPRNLGVSALTASAVRCVLHAHPDADVFLLDYSRHSATYNVRIGGRVVTVPLVNLRFSKKFYLSNNVALLLILVLLIKLVPVRRWREQLMSTNAVLRRLQRTDLVAAISGGDSFSDLYGLGRLLYVALPQILAVACGKRLVLLPQTLGPFRSWIARAIARYLLKHAQRVYSRDHIGIPLATRLLGKRAHRNHLHFCYDLAFVLDPVVPARIDIEGLTPNRSSRPLVGVNVSGLLYIGGYTRNNMFGLATDYGQLIRSLISLLIGQKDANILLIPHFFGPAKYGESDEAACDEIYLALGMKFPGRIGRLRGAYDQSEIKYIIGRCNFFIGSRMHACIAAVSQHVPAVSLAYSNKFMGVMQTLGIDSLVADICRMSEGEILALVERTFNEREVLRRHLAQKIPQVQENVLRLFCDLEDTTRSGAAYDPATLSATQGERAAYRKAPSS